MKELANYIRSIPDFPKPGIIFRDVVPLIESGEGFAQAIAALRDGVGAWGKIDRVAAPEARGFIFGAPLASALGVGLTPIRKSGKLPFETVKADYTLEYGSNTVEIHKDSIAPGTRVLLVDDLLATGGTIAACRRLLEDQGAIVVGAAFVIELTDLKGRDALPGLPVFSAVQFEGE